MKKTIFKGMATAMVTPMTPEGVDYEALGRFIDFQLESGINALVAVGTTGESATLTPEERERSLPLPLTGWRAGCLSLPEPEPTIPSTP